jgi:hypothetical protein
METNANRAAKLSVPKEFEDSNRQATAVLELF